MNGYLFVFERSLASRLPGDAVREAVREIESHVLERVAQADPALDPRESLEKILSDLGSPQRVAEAYSLGRTVDDAVVTGRLVPFARAIGRIAMSTVGGFFSAIALFVGYTIGVAFLFDRRGEADLAGSRGFDRGRWLPPILRDRAARAARGRRLRRLRADSDRARLGSSLPRRHASCRPPVPGAVARPCNRRFRATHALTYGVELG